MAVAALAMVAESADARPPLVVPVGVPDVFEPMGHRWALRYRWERVSHYGNRVGTTPVSTDQILAMGYELAPKQRIDNRHVFGLQFSPGDRFSFVAEVPLVQRDTLYRSRITEFSNESLGLGDVGLIATLVFMEHDRQSWHIGVRMNIPTGDIQQVGGLSPVGTGLSRLSYPMQLGSGTWDFAPNLTYFADYDAISWGVQFRGLFRTGRNDEGYRLGHRYSSTAWASYSWRDLVELSLRLEWALWQGVNGADPQMDPSQIPTADPNRQRSNRIDLGPGLRVRIPQLKGQHLAFEVLWPVYQSLNGPQPEVDSLIHLGWQWEF